MARSEPQWTGEEFEGDDAEAAPPHPMERYLLKDERLVVGVRRHWATVWEPVALAVGSLIAILWIGFTATPGRVEVVNALWWVWLAVLARAAYRLFEWRHEYLIATDRRIMLVYGFITRKVGMLPLAKVTDMTFHRTLGGLALGYGTFVIESAGQDQALREINFIPSPEATYRAVIHEIFAKSTDLEVVPPVADDEGLLARHRRRVSSRIAGWYTDFRAGRAHKRAETPSNAALAARPPRIGHHVPAPPPLIPGHGNSNNTIPLAFPWRTGRSRGDDVIYRSGDRADDSDYEDPTRF